MVSPGLPINACVISLARTPERLEQFHQRLGVLSAEVHWHPGVDGFTIDCDELVATGIIDSSALSWPKGQIGCALSHLKAWQACAESDQPLLIFEDDAVLAADWNQRLLSVVKQVSQRPWDLLLLGWNLDSCLQFEWAKNQSLTALFRPRYSKACELAVALQSAHQPVIYRLITALGLAGYVISPTGASRLLKLMHPLRTLPIETPELPPRNCFSLDGQLNSCYTDINEYVCFPPIVIGENDQSESLTK
jgi:glycosyl transferase family 25